MSLDTESKVTKLNASKEHENNPQPLNDIPEQMKYVRRGPDRRKNSERRDDPRVEGKRSLLAWLKSIINPRVGVDRRKGGDRRKDRESVEGKYSNVLTPEELKHLLEK